MQLRHIAVSLLLVLGTLNAYAEAEDDRREELGNSRAMHGIAMEGNEQQMQAQAAERRRERIFGLPDISIYSAQNSTQSDPNFSSDAGRRQGRLSLEERRMLRRQIGEVGHDIYAPKP